MLHFSALVPVKVWIQSLWSHPDLKSVRNHDNTASASAKFPLQYSVSV